MPLQGKTRPMSDFVPNWRHSDPYSSEVAGTSIEGSGKAQHQRETALVAVATYPGRTSRELAEITGLDRYMLARRLPELLRFHKVSRTEEGECKWYPKGQMQVEMGI